MRWLLTIGGFLAALIVIVLVVGYSLPVKHVAARSVELNAPPDRVWETITDVQSMPEMESRSQVGRSHR